MKKRVIVTLIVLICAGIIYAATLDSLPKNEVMMLDTDKIIEVQCGTRAVGKSIKMNIPDKLFDLSVSARIICNDDISKGAVIKMRVPEKYADDVSKRVLEICPTCKILATTAVPISTPTKVY
jgi:hypothetical protein